MGSFDKQTRRVEGVDAIEVFVDDLFEYTVPANVITADPEDAHDEPWQFYDVGGDNIPYTLQMVLEYYHRNNRAVKITIEDAGESLRAISARENAARAEQERQRGLVALEAESRHRARQSHIPKY